MELKKKRDVAIALIKGTKIFKCPVCDKVMDIEEERLSCGLRHSFDFSRKGSINLLGQQNTAIYTKELFEARHKVCRGGLYAPLIDNIAGRVEEYRHSANKEKLRILDAGCGEGSNIRGLHNAMDQREGHTLVGIDISRESINIAASGNAGVIWCVGDLAKLPLQDRAFDILLNILSPASYGEFERILEDEGLIIKVVPGDNYLKEIRQELLGDTDRKYSNTRVLEHFKEKLELVDRQRLSYEFPVAEGLLADIFKMTPLTWGKVTQDLRKDIDISKITVDLEIMVGRKKKQ